MLRFFVILTFFGLANGAHAFCFHQPGVNLKALMNVADYRECTDKELVACVEAARVYLQKKSGRIGGTADTVGGNIATNYRDVLYANARASLNAVQIEIERRR